MAGTVRSAMRVVGARVVVGAVVGVSPRETAAVVGASARVAVVGARVVVGASMAVDVVGARVVVVVVVGASMAVDVVGASVAVAVVGARARVAVVGASVAVAVPAPRWRWCRQVLWLARRRQGDPLHWRPSRRGRLRHRRRGRQAGTCEDSYS